MSTITTPLRFHPVYQPYIWGGEKLRSRLGRTDTPEGIVAESWEISSREDGMGVVSEGVHSGKTFQALLKEDAGGLLGRRVKKDDFPLLIKVLDAAKTLSVQVHPNDETAAKFGGEAKTETWYILEADPGACVYCGIQNGVSPEQFRAAIADNTLEPLLKKIPVKAGDAIFVPGGRVHAIASGCLLLEVQQNSNTTYRIYDWGRVDAQGQGRQLHIDQALQVSIFEEEGSALTPAKPLSPLAGLPREQIMISPYFLLEKLSLDCQASLPGNPESFQVLFAIDGDLEVSSGGEAVKVPAGSSVLIPAAAPATDVKALSGAMHFMRITQP
ncbi:class I mannose-6-phosphate isomerase [Kiritimatiellaeota bacterium B1221]|nr:class I mannose-6-phosphate isomerase [Kiritimatiellaeota bacterium B1221]